jgi:hypothetical protein
MFSGRRQLGQALSKIWLERLDHHYPVTEILQFCHNAVLTITNHVLRLLDGHTFGPYNSEEALDNYKEFSPRK